MNHLRANRDAEYEVDLMGKGKRLTNSTDDDRWFKKVIWKLLGKDFSVTTSNKSNDTFGFYVATNEYMESKWSTFAFKLDRKRLIWSLYAYPRAGRSENRPQRAGSGETLKELVKKARRMARQTSRTAGVNPYLNTPPTKLKRDVEKEDDPKKKKQMTDALNAWRITVPGPFRKGADMNNVEIEMMKLAREIVASRYDDELPKVVRELNKEAKRVISTIKKNGGSARMGRLHTEEGEYAEDRRYPASTSRRFLLSRVITTKAINGAKPAQILIQAAAYEEKLGGVGYIKGPYWGAKVNNNYATKWLPSLGSMPMSKRQIDNVVDAIPEAIRKYPEKFGVEA